MRDSWASLLCESFRIQSTDDIQLNLMHLSALYIQCRSGFVFLLCFWKCGFSEFKCIFLVKLDKAILDQVCRVHEILPLWSRTCQWTVKYNFLYEKIKSNTVHIEGACTSVALEQNRVQDTLAALLVHSQSCRMKSRVELHWIWFGLVVYNFFQDIHCWSEFVILMFFPKLWFFCVPMQFLGQFM